MNTSSYPFTTGQGFLLGLSALSWLAVAGDMQRLAETMVPVEQNGPPVQHNVAGQRDVLTGDYIGFCTGCGWRAVYATAEEMNEGGREHVAVMEKLWTASLD